MYVRMYVCITFRYLETSCITVFTTRICFLFINQLILFDFVPYFLMFDTSWKDHDNP